jgi:DNA-binding LacI/PurR family transcriptional regulator
MPTVKQIAEQLDISSATVSRVLNSRPGIAAATRQRVLDAARDLGFHRDAGLRQSRYLGFVHPLGKFNGSLGDYHSSVIGGLGTVFGRYRYDLALVDPYRDKRPDESFSEFFLRKQLHGLVIQIRPENEKTVLAIADERLPVVLIASDLQHEALCSIHVDSARGYEEAVEHLFHLGHQRIGYVSRVSDDFDHTERVDGIRRAMSRLGLEQREEWHYTCEAEGRAGESVIRRMMTLPERPTAMLFTDVMPGLGAVRACNAMGMKLPDDLSIVGFDDASRRYDLSPTVSCVCQNALKLGEEAASMLVQLLAEEIDVPLRKSLPATFEVCGTTGPAPD